MKHIPNRIFKFLRGFLPVIMMGFLLLGLFNSLAPVPAIAQESPNQGVAGFTACNFNRSQAGQQDLLQNCLRQVFTFAFVVGIFLIAFRVGIAAIDDYNPFTSGNSVNDTVNLVWEITLGLILIGGPVLILNTINPATLNLNFLNLGNLGSSSSVGSNTSSGSNGNTSSGQGTGQGQTPTTTGGSTANGVNNAVNVLSQGVSQTTSPQSFLFGIQANAQESQQISTEEAEKILVDVLNIEQKCANILVDQASLNDCKVIEDTQFIEARRNIPDRLRRLYTPILDAKNTFYSTNFTSNEAFVRPVEIQSVPLKRQDCRMYFAVVDFKDATYTQSKLLGAEVCSEQLGGLAFWKNENGKIVPRANETIASGSPVSGQESVIHFIN